MLYAIEMRNTFKNENNNVSLNMFHLKSCFLLGMKSC